MLVLYAFEGANKNPGMPISKMVNDGNKIFKRNWYDVPQKRK